MTQDLRSTEFCFSGKFLGYVFKDGYKIKRLNLATTNGEYSIKVTKLARASLLQTLLPGDQIQVGGWQEFDRDTNDLKFKAYWIRPLESVTQLELPVPKPQTLAPQTSHPKPKKQSILVCQKSSCMKRGGKAICGAIEKALSDRGLDDQVTLKGTGCMKACGKVPVVLMPTKARYTKLNPKDVATLIDEHFAPAIEPTAPAIEPLVPEKKSLPISA
ncbi:MAG: (2Fe-2S) ferredoxin domain-containing protein [Leptolyngbya sp. Prado105]|jgi:(2Fe-2S) ferredoxin|nr:(2Fe-2S) ferredoxin domain-containing protein [Leptolyngbya sp. Prado105]